VGVCALATGAYLQFGRGGDEHTGAPTVPTSGSASPTSPVASSSPAGQSRRAVPESVPAVPSSSRTTAGAGRPTGIHIAQLGVDAPVVAISAVHAALTPPSDPSKVGWWSGGAQPGGKTGSAVITGHTVHNGGGAFVAGATNFACTIGGASFRLYPSGFTGQISSGTLNFQVKVK